jgi:hypothetical protein
MRDVPSGATSDVKPSSRLATHALDLSENVLGLGTVVLVRVEQVVPPGVPSEGEAYEYLPANASTASMTRR